MKPLTLLAAALAMSFSFLASAQMKGMEMKDMDMDKKMKSAKNAKSSAVHKGTGVVTNIDRAGGKVTLKHDPIKSLNWPTMTMAFAVKDKAMLDSLAKNKKVEFEFVQQGEQFVITSIK